jgi:hypothetical protein
LNRNVDANLNSLDFDSQHRRQTSTPGLSFSR